MYTKDLSYVLKSSKRLYCIGRLFDFLEDERRQDRQERSRPSAPFNPPDRENEESRSLVDLYDEVIELQDELYSDMYTDNVLFPDTSRDLLDFSALVNFNNIYLLFKISLSNYFNICILYKPLKTKKERQ